VLQGNDLNQMVLMGDIFDLLIGGFDHLRLLNSEAIDKINAIAQKIEVIYLEGNHDFVLQEIFPFVKVISLQNQPLKAIWGDKKIFLAHGDIFTPLGYRIYSTLVRSKMILKILNIVTFNWVNNWFIAWQHDRLIPKKICQSIEDFQEKTSPRLQKYGECDVIIEGHFHQGKMWKKEGQTYVGLPSFACDGTFVFLTEKGFIFTKNIKEA
jgi:UDP-2,3-diacylglucosamine hydrolase